MGREDRGGNHPQQRAGHQPRPLRRYQEAGHDGDQVLTDRVHPPDILPPLYIDELAQRRDRLPPVPVEAIQAETGRELQQPLSDRFAAMANRLVLSIVFGSRVMNTSLIMGVYHPEPARNWLAQFFGIGLVAVAPSARSVE